MTTISGRSAGRKRRTLLYFARVKRRRKNCVRFSLRVQLFLQPFKIYGTSGSTVLNLEQSMLSFPLSLMVVGGYFRGFVRFPCVQYGRYGTRPKRQFRFLFKYMQLMCGRYFVYLIARPSYLPAMRYVGKFK